MNNIGTKAPTPEIIQQIYNELVSSGDDPALRKYISENYVYKNPFEDTVGHQPIKDLVKAQLESFRNYKLTLDRIIIDHDKKSVAILWTITGIFEKAFFGYPPTGKKVHFSGVTMQEWDNGQAITGWGYSNIHEKLSL